MKVILLADVKKVGQKGEVKEVSDGYAQNVLLPRKLALPGTVENLKKVQKETERKEDTKAFSQALLNKAFSDADGKTVTIHARANEQGKLFETLHERHVVAALREQLHVEIPESAVRLTEPLKTTGKRQVSLGGKATLMVTVTQ